MSRFTTHLFIVLFSIFIFSSCAKEDAIQDDTTQNAVMVKQYLLKDGEAIYLGTKPENESILSSAKTKSDIHVGYLVHNSYPTDGPFSVSPGYYGIRLIINNQGDYKGYVTLQVASDIAEIEVENGIYEAYNYVDHPAFMTISYRSEGSSGNCVYQVIKLSDR